MQTQMTSNNEQLRFYRCAGKVEKGELASTCIFCARLATPNAFRLIHQLPSTFINGQCPNRVQK